MKAFKSTKTLIAFTFVLTLMSTPLRAQGNEPPAPKPTITDIQVTDNSDTSVTITWTTEIESDSTVHYGETTFLAENIKETSLITNHLIQLTGLLPGTKYHYKVESVTAQGSSKASPNKQFTTTTAGEPENPPDTPPPPTGNLPSPSLNLPRAIELDGVLEVSYPEIFVVENFNWTFANVQNPQGGINASPLFLGTTVASLTTLDNKLDLKTYPIETGYYSVTVTARVSGVQTQPAQAFMSIVNNNLSGVRVYPNPWNGDKHSGQAVTFDTLPLNTTITLYSLAGENVLTLPKQNESISWNLTDSSGDPVSSGVYIYAISSDGGETKTGKLAILK